MELSRASCALPVGVGTFAVTKEHIVDVIVIGAGISGLACAATLRNAGLRVVVLEARPRIGGRIHTIPLAEGAGRPTWAVDLGGAWVHGIGSSGAPNHLYSLACELQLGCLPTDYNDAAVYTAEGVRLADSVVADIESLYHVFEQHLHSMLHAPDPRLALMPIQTALEAFATSRCLSSAQRAHLAFAVSNHMEHYWAGETTHMGVAALDEEVLPGGDVVLARGYAGIVERLAVGLDVRLGHEVLAVQYGGEDAGISSSGGNGSGTSSVRAPGGGVQLQQQIMMNGSGGRGSAQQPAAAVAVTARILGGSGGGAGASSAGGELVRLSARAAVVTLPVGVLRSGAVAFSPPLQQTDPRKSEAISQLGTAVYNKVIMLFEPADVFWDDTAFIYRIPAPYEAGRWSYFLNLHKVTGAPILIAFNLGESAAALEALGDEETLAGAMQALAGLYGKERVRRPRQAVVTRWGSDPHSRMSYTYIPAGLTTAAFDDVARPVLGSLFFAGEAAHRRHYGTAHGAYESGLQAASAVVRELTLQRQWQLQMAARRLLQQQGRGQQQRRVLRATQRPTGRRVVAGKVASTVPAVPALDGAVITSTAARSTVPTTFSLHGAGGGGVRGGREVTLALVPTGGVQTRSGSSSQGGSGGSGPSRSVEDAAANGKEGKQVCEGVGRVEEELALAGEGVTGRCNGKEEAEERTGGQMAEPTGAELIGTAVCQRSKL